MRDVTFSKSEFQGLAANLRSYAMVKCSTVTDDGKVVDLTVDEVCGAMGAHDRELAAKLRTWLEVSSQLADHINTRCG